MRNLLSVVVLLVCALPSPAQVTMPDRTTGQGVREQVFGLGFSVGFASGIGVTFRHHFPGKVSWEATGGVIKVDEKVNYSFGGELQLDLDRGTGGRFFASVAGGYYYSAPKGGNNTMAGPGRLGVGIGGELPIGGGFHMSGKLLFTWFSDGTILPLPGAGVAYYFH
jgi:hypothetical protein